MKLLIFSDIHNDLKTLDGLLSIEADYYFAAGDLVSWGRGLDRAGETLARRAAQTSVIPGNHERDSGIDAMCRKHGLLTPAALVVASVRESGAAALASADAGFERVAELRLYRPADVA